MNKNKSDVYYIENLTLDGWVFSILPYFLGNRMQALRGAVAIYYFNHSMLGLWAARWMLWLGKKQLKRTDFVQGDTRDHDGNLVWINTMNDALLLHAEMANNVEFQRAVKNYGKGNSLDIFLGKCLIFNDLMVSDVFLLQKFVFFIRCVQCQEHLKDNSGMSQQNVFLFLQEKPWFSDFTQFVKSRGIHVIPTVNFRVFLNVFLLRFDSMIKSLKDLIKNIIYCVMAIKHYRKQWARRIQSKSSREATQVVGNTSKGLGQSGPRIAVEYYGNLNLNIPGMFSDLFFLQESSLCAQDLLLYFGLPQAPVTSEEWADIQKQGASAVVTNPLAAATPEVPLFHRKRSKATLNRYGGEGEPTENFLEYIWLKEHILDYYRRRDYWIDFMTQNNIKIHVTWFKYNLEHCAKIDAVKKTGGVGIVYQRSCDYFPAPWMFTKANVVFGFSKFEIDAGCQKRSCIPYYVLTGYLGDYRFNLLRKQASVVRGRIQSHGAKHIVAYFDEHAKNHPRWDLFYSAAIKHYTYLLNKVLENPWFGLILKPKAPSTLRSRLKPISDLLCQAEATGRCFIFEEGKLQASYPPAAASLGADVAIHGHLFAATAGIEAALAGTPTVMLDEEGIVNSPLYGVLGVNKIIFKDITILWQACTDHWNTPGGIPGFADWTDVLNEFDPFRDGRAAERMGTYLKWLIEGFKDGLPRETVLADAAERYTKIWGKDKILSVNLKNSSQRCCGVVKYARDERAYYQKA